MTKRRQNLFGFGRKEEAPVKRVKRSAMTLAQAARAAKQAGYRGVDFRDWLEAKRLTDRSEQVISRLGDAYRAGMDEREKLDSEKEKAESAKQAKKQAHAEAQRARAEAQEIKAAGGIKGAIPSTAEIEKAYEGGATTLREAMRALGVQMNPTKFTAFLTTRPASGGIARSKGRRNPASGAIEGYTEFHGHEPTEEITVVKKVHFHKHLAAAGKLKRLVIRGIDYRKTGRVVTLQKFAGAMLAFNEKKNQLFVEGGDQKVRLEDFGISSGKAHELETLGRVTDIDYHTNKSHLGDEGGEATYQHGFRMTNENGKHIIVKIARYPDLIYSVPDEQLLFSGGSYFIRAEGIDQ